MALARLSRSFDTAYGILLCASIVVNPIAWDHYMILTALPFVCGNPSLTHRRALAAAPGGLPFEFLLLGGGSGSG